MITGPIIAVRPAAQAIPAGPGLIAGPAGKSAYQAALDQGFVGTVQQWLASLVGQPGANGINGATGATPWQTPPAAWAASTAYTAIAPASVVTYNGACYICSASHMSGASFDPSKWVAITATVPQSGAPLQRVGASTTTMSTTSAQVAINDTVPTTSTTTSILSVSITPKAAANKLRVRAVLSGSLSSLGSIVAALFQGGGANAVSANFVTCPAQGYMGQVVVSYNTVAGGTSPITFALAAGCNNGGTLTINGIAGSRYLGGVMASTIDVEEFAA